MNASAGGAGALHATVNESEVTSEKKSCVIGRNPEIEWQQLYYEMLAPVIKDLLSWFAHPHRKEEGRVQEWRTMRWSDEEMQSVSISSEWWKLDEEKWKMVMEYDKILIV